MFILFNCITFLLILSSSSSLLLIDCRSEPSLSSCSQQQHHQTISHVQNQKYQQQQQQNRQSAASTTNNQENRVPNNNRVPDNSDSNNNNNNNDNNQCQLQVVKSTNEIQSFQSFQTINDFDCEHLNFCDDRLGFEAILFLHRQLDEDANGDIDIAESDEFIRDELKYENGAERQKAFHGNDKHITVDELWRAWRISTVHNWTVDQTVEWLNEIVELPKYQRVFETNAINGITLPRLAANPQIFSLLGINNPIHKQKIALKAMDAVLFGEPKSKSSNKDVIMGFLFIFATVVGYYAYRQNKYSKEHIRKMTKDIETLSVYEKQIETMQSELDKLKQEQQETSKEKEEMERKLRAKEMIKANNGEYFDIKTLASDTDDRMRELEDELRETHCELKRVQQAYESRQWIPPRALQLYLQFTYEIENRYYNMKKANAEHQLQAAREGCDKLKKKRSSLFGAFRMAHGSAIDYVDNTIIQARTLLAELTQEMHERIKRWKQIELFCGFEIIHNPGLSHLEQFLYGTTGISNSSNQLKTSASTASMSKLLRRGSEATIAEEDAVSIISAQTKPYSPWHSTIQAVQAIERWQNQQISTNSIPIKKASIQSLYQIPQKSSMNDENCNDSDFYIGEDSQQLANDGCRSGLPINRKKSSIIPTKVHQSFNIRSSSDGVERHFEEINQSLYNDQHSNICSQPNISSSDMSFDTSSITSAYYPTRQIEINNSNNSIYSISIQPKDLLFTNESNDETISSDSNESTNNINATASSNINGNDLINMVNDGDGNNENQNNDHQKRIDRKNKKRHVGLFSGIRVMKKKN
uniref:Stromal interaction molecule homolog n=1 Tax=Dermatophagoides pteronyssinus TaxID=6956 RepID=A0A6P6XM43_DERPT|nr:stromal interaction molecule homolog [Dermatophagoides pteronyssinus]